MDDIQIASTILQQLGGRRFLAMTGATHPTAQEFGLSFKLPTRSDHPVNYVRITLNGRDTYDMEFADVRGLAIQIRSTAEDIYCDQLQDVFTRETGLHTHL